MQAIFKVHSDFFMYKSGVYEPLRIHEEDPKNAYHSVKLLGWGIENEVPYWVILFKLKFPLFSGGRSSGILAPTIVLIIYYTISYGYCLYLLLCVFLWLLCPTKILDPQKIHFNTPLISI